MADRPKLNREALSCPVVSVSQGCLISKTLSPVSSSQPISSILYKKEQDEKKNKDYGSLNDCTLKDIIERINHPYLKDIIERINHQYLSDDRTKRILFICYRKFCTRSQLLTALEKFYEDPTLAKNCHLWNKANCPRFEAKAKRIMKIKLLNLIRFWLRDFFYDFDSHDLQSIQNWTNLISDTGNDTTTACVNSILGELKLIKTGKRHRVASKIFLCDYPSTLYGSDRTPNNIFDVRSEEIARQMCLIDHEIFASILPHEFLGQSLKKTNRETEAPNMTRIITHFNKVSCWCQTMILLQPHLRNRSKVLGRLLKICYYLDLNGNLNSLCAIISGILANPIFRLKKTFASLNPKCMRLLKGFTELLKTDFNQRNLRKRMALLVEPGIPQVGLVLADILSIETANVYSITEKINFSKYGLIYDRIEWCLKFQEYPYHFKRVEKVQEELKKLFKTIPHDFLYKLSLILEPRDN